MATRLQHFPRISGEHPNSKYPWSQWMTGVWRIESGSDFSVSLSHMRSSLYSRASQQGVSVRVITLREQEALIFEFYPKARA